MRVAVIGDVGGHLDLLQAELTRLGADPDTGQLPADLTVVQVGDLVHRGPRSAEVVALVDRYLAGQPDQWVQLVGNHESIYVADRSFTWREHIGRPAEATLQRWWAGGRMTVAAAVTTPTEDFLITHAGLTSTFWRQFLDAPGSATGAARRLNGLTREGEGRRDLPFRGGTMLWGSPDWSVGPVWASANAELVPSWLHEPMPFSQVHGHSTITRWRTVDGVPTTPGDDPVARLTTTDPVARHETSRLDGGQIIGVDPGHGLEPHATWRAWVTEGRVVR